MASDVYSRWVSWMKLALPLAAIGILSTMFLFWRGADIERTAAMPPYLGASRGVEIVKAPDYAGVTADGSAVRILAEGAWPERAGAERMQAEAVRARFELAGGDVAEISAESGLLDPDESLLTLEGDVLVEMESGWSLRTERLDTRLDWTRMASPEAVETQGPIGELDAGAMVLTREAGEDSPLLMSFDQGVHLVYRP